MIHTKIVGVSFIPNDRFSLMTLGENLFLDREPDNQYDPFAVAVVREGKGRIGYLNAKNGLARQISEALEKGEKIGVHITDFTGDWVPNVLSGIVHYSPRTTDGFGLNIRLVNIIEGESI